MGRDRESCDGNKIVREMKEGRNLPTLLSSPLIKIRVFNWSKLI